MTVIGQIIIDVFLLTIALGLIIYTGIEQYRADVENDRLRAELKSLRAADRQRRQEELARWDMELQTHEAQLAPILLQLDNCRMEKEDAEKAQRRQIYDAAREAYEDRKII